MADTSTQEQQQQPMNFLATLKNKAPQPNGTGMRLYESIYPLSALSHFLLPEIQSDGLFERFSTKTSLLFTHRFSLSLSSNRKTTTTTEKNGVRTARVYITVRTTTTDDEDNDGFGGGADSWDEKDANDADEE